MREPRSVVFTLRLSNSEVQTLRELAGEDLSMGQVLRRGLRELQDRQRIEGRMEDGKSLYEGESRSEERPQL